MMVDFQKTVLWIALVIVGFLLWNTWNEEHLATANTAQVSLNESTNNADLPQVTAIDNSSSNAPSPVTTTNAIVTAGSDAATTPVSADRFIHVKTDVLSLLIDTVGGQIVELDLLDYPVSVQEPNQPVRLFDQKKGSIYMAQSGIISEDGPDKQQGAVQYRAKDTAFVMQDGQNQLDVVLTWESPDGVVFNKHFLFDRGQYVMNVRYDIENNSNKAWQGQFYAQLKRERAESAKSSLMAFPTYLGAAISTPEKRYEKVTFDDMDKEVIDRTVTDGWVAMVQHYFTSAWIPEDNEPHRYYSRHVGDQYWIGLMASQVILQPGEKSQQQARLYAGPEITSELSKIAPGLELTVDYGWFWPISQFLFWAMKHLHAFLGNWGLSIIGITILIKLLFYPLSASSYRSMAKLRQVQNESSHDGIV